MRDFGAVKVICRVITLIEFIAFMFAAYMMPEFMDQGIFADVKEQTRYILVGLGIALVVMMIVSLIVKYTMKDANKVYGNSLSVLYYVCFVSVYICMEVRKTREFYSMHGIQNRINVYLNEIIHHSYLTLQSSCGIFISHYLVLQSRMI